MERLIVKRTNLQPVYTVSECSGADILYIFPTYEAAEKQRKTWEDKTMKAFNEGHYSVIQSDLQQVVKPDGTWGVENVISVADHALPSGIRTHNVGTLDAQNYEGAEDVRGDRLIQWDTWQHSALVDRP
jgi:hypothetical protein